MKNIKIANIFKYAIISHKNGGTFFQTEGGDENNQKLVGNSQTNTQVVMPTADVVVVGDGSSSADAIPLSDNSTEEEQQSNSESSLSLVYTVQSGRVCVNFNF